MEHLRGRYNHIDAILEAEKIIYGPSDFDVENNKSRFDCVIIHTDDEQRSFWFDAWKLFIALVAFYSSQVAMFIATFQIELSDTLFHPVSAFDYLYSFGELAMLLELLIGFLTDYRDTVTDTQIRQPTKILWHHMTGSFIPEILAVFPFTTIVYRAGVSYAVPL